MKLIAFPLVLACGLLETSHAEIGTPKVSIGLSNGNHGKIGGLEPKVNWKATGEYGSFDMEGGIDMTVEDVDSMPYSVWGKIKRSIVGGFDLSARADAKAQSLSQVGLEFRLDGDTTSVQVLCSAAADSFSVNKVNAKKSVTLFGGKLSVNPRFLLGAGTTEATVAYDLEKTSIVVDATSSSQKLTVGRQIGDDLFISPSITTDTRFSLDVAKSTDSVGKITTTLTPNECINLKWEDGPWTANINAPMSGIKFDEGVNVGIKRKVDIL
mmetsp:Transcript_4212/g.6393  ORF Transcript_4212/g.6393 Transcript_4212/m.6393 type:complete len:268 (+) Transcript_4212:116-919(+)|eukprot:CAMPEP_0195291612 /NCGR_PEP_ID=MMETSP0707-20130614/7893_1 /TAXON_ID=33640 /ORGANISM="Asterionellopsis glacialis, Strain CCMP134" /LENGTH=267 /DNA_ID=CAMNT_0040351945 /DNA_START=68 /DNA_END=871 /DNA_ORIENTATION=-